MDSKELDKELAPKLQKKNERESREKKRVDEKIQDNAECVNSVIKKYNLVKEIDSLVDWFNSKTIGKKLDLRWSELETSEELKALDVLPYYEITISRNLFSDTQYPNYIDIEILIRSKRRFREMFYEILGKNAPLVPEIFVTVKRETGDYFREALLKPTKIKPEQTIGWLKDWLINILELE